MMENAPSNRLSSAKWSRNLNEDSQTEANRMRLLERQRQILETKLQRRQLQSASSGTSGVSSGPRPATSGSGIRSRAARATPSSSDGFFSAATKNPQANQQDGAYHYRNYQDQADSRGGSIIGDVEEHSNSYSSAGSASNSPSTRNLPRARTSVPANRGGRFSGVAEGSPVSSLVNSGKSPSRKNVNNGNGNGTSINSRNSSTNLRSLSRSEANLQSSISGSSNGASPSRTKNKSDLLGPNPLTTVLSDEELLHFVTQPISADVTLQCTIIRDKKGLDRSFYPTYYMHLQDIIINQPGGAVSGESALKSSTSTGNFNNNSSGLEGTATISMSESVDSLESIKSNEDEENVVKNGSQQTKTPSPSNGGQNGANNKANAITGGRKVFVLSGRRRKKSKTYLIGNNAFDISRDRCLAKLKSNVLGTQFTAIRLQQNGVRHEIASISYETNVLGFKGPRKMAILLPKIDEKTNVICNLSLQEEYRRSSRAIVLLKNKTPIWNEETQSYVLNFHGRVTQASVKNFQLVVSEIPGAGNVGSRKSLSEMRRSASSHQLRNGGRGSEADSGVESIRRRKNGGLDDDEDEDDEDEVEGDEDEEEEDSDDEKYRKGANGSTRTNFASTRPLSRSSGSGLNKGFMGNQGDQSANKGEEGLTGNTDQLVSLQFGRVSNTQFSCDVSWPLSLVQAFAIALSSFDSKLACE